MKKLFVILMALALVASFAVTAFATDSGNGNIPSPTDVPQVIVDFDSQHSGKTTDVSREGYNKGSTVTFVAPESKYEFLGFKIECGDYEVVSGGAYIYGAGTIGTAGKYTLVLKVNADAKVTAMYDTDAKETEPTATTKPTTATRPDDEAGDSPQTGDSVLVYCIAGALILGVVGLAFAGKKLLKKEN